VTGDNDHKDCLYNRKGRKGVEKKEVYSCVGTIIDENIPLFYVEGCGV
jgi:hypothetical protein